MVRKPINCQQEITFMNNKIFPQDKKIRIAIVGCGRISKNHFDSIAQHGQDLELAAICDLDSQTLKAHTDLYQVSGYSNIVDMLREEQLDMVTLCTPSGIHPEQTILAAHHGVHVITEKPMATRWGDV